MNAFWDFYWPALVAAIVIGVLVGAIAFRATLDRRPKTKAFRRRATLLAIAGAVLVSAVAAVWDGPAGTAERFAASIERQSREALVNWEMTQVQAHIERAPLERTIVLSGPADDFQRSELVRIIDGVPGVANVRWTDMPDAFALPLLAEAVLASLGFFGLGLLLAYLLELRRRYRAQWSW